MASAKQKDRTKNLVKDEYDFTLTELLDALNIPQQDRAQAKRWDMLINGNSVTLVRSE